MFRSLGANDLDLLEQLFAHLPQCPFFIKDRELRYVAANEAMLRLCGARRPSDLYGKKAADFFPGPIAAEYEKLDSEVIRSGKPVSRILSLSAARRARSTWLMFGRYPVRAEDGSVVGVAGAARNLPPPKLKGPSYVALAKIADDIRDTLDEPKHISDFVGAFHLSKSQLEREFRKVFGCTPKAFQQQLRIERALELLESDMSIARVAHEAGYSDHSAFTRRFREVLGMSPREYRATLGRIRAGPHPR